MHEVFDDLLLVGAHLEGGVTQVEALVLLQHALRTQEAIGEGLGVHDGERLADLVEDGERLDDGVHFGSLEGFLQALVLGDYSVDGEDLVLVFDLEVGLVEE